MNQNSSKRLGLAALLIFSLFMIYTLSCFSISYIQQPSYFAQTTVPDLESTNQTKCENAIMLKGYFYNAMNFEQAGKD
jgi:hypothetical protein